MVGTGAIFTMLFVMLGPLKLLGPFAAQTHHLEPTEVQQIAFIVFAIATVGAIAGSFLGVALLGPWQVSTPALMLAASIVLFLVALRLVLEQYQAVHPPAAPLPAEPTAAVLKLVFPLVLTPYGIAALIALISVADGTGRIPEIVALLALVMVLDLLAMLFARSIMRGMTLLVLHVTGAILGVLQVGLAVQLALRQLVILGVLDISVPT